MTEIDAPPQEPTEEQTQRANAVLADVTSNMQGMWGEKAQAIIARALTAEAAAVRRECEAELRRKTVALDRAIDERDEAEQALSQAYYLITGVSPEWSNNFGPAEAIENIDGAQQAFRKAIAASKAEVKRLSTTTDEMVLDVARILSREMDRVSPGAALLLARAALDAALARRDGK